MATNSREYLARIRAQRHEVDGRLVSYHPSCTHGISSGYITFGCRCPECSKANRKRLRESDERRKANLDALVELGLRDPNAPRNRPSKKANNKRFSDKARSTLITRDGKPYNPEATHGTLTAYNTYGCRCPKCTDAKRQYDLQRKNETDK